VAGTNSRASPNLSIYLPSRRPGLHSPGFAEADSGCVPIAQGTVLPVDGPLWVRTLSKRMPEVAVRFRAQSPERRQSAYGEIAPVLAVPVA
jgi:hypothetical protein